MIYIIDYEAGNIHSVARAFRHFGKEVTITKDLSAVTKDDLIVLPGVGAFGHAVKSLQDNKLFTLLQEKIKAGYKFFGVCLGLQLLFESSEESNGVKGLAVFSGTVKRFSEATNLCIPQIGWNTVTINHPSFKASNGLHFYFVHSYYVQAKDEAITLATTNYGIDYVSAVVKDNVIATQFHPEKSGKVGLAFLQSVMEYFNV